MCWVQDLGSVGDVAGSWASGGLVDYALARLCAMIACSAFHLVSGVGDPSICWLVDRVIGPPLR